MYVDLVDVIKGDCSEKSNFLPVNFCVFIRTILRVWRGQQSN